MAVLSVNGRESDSMEVNLSEITKEDAVVMLGNKVNEFLFNVPANEFNRCYMYVSYDTSKVYYG